MNCVREDVWKQVRTLCIYWGESCCNVFLLSSIMFEVQETSSNFNNVRLKIMACFSWVDSYFKAYSCIVIATWHLFSTTKLFSKLKCSCSPFAFSIWEILLHSSCRHMYRTLYFCPFTLMLFKMPHKSKGSSSCFVLSTGYCNYCMKGLSY